MRLIGLLDDEITPSGLREMLSRQANSKRYVLLFPTGKENLTDEMRPYTPKNPIDRSAKLAFNCAAFLSSWGLPVRDISDNPDDPLLAQSLFTLGRLVGYGYHFLVPVQLCEEPSAKLNQWNSFFGLYLNDPDCTIAAEDIEIAFGRSFHLHYKTVNKLYYHLLNFVANLPTEYLAEPHTQLEKARQLHPSFAKGFQQGLDDAKRKNDSWYRPADTSMTTLGYTGREALAPPTLAAPPGTLVSPSPSSPLELLQPTPVAKAKAESPQSSLLAPRLATQKPTQDPKRQKFGTDALENTAIASMPERLPGSRSDAPIPVAPTLQSIEYYDGGLTAQVTFNIHGASKTYSIGPLTRVEKRQALFAIYQEHGLRPPSDFLEKPESIRTATLIERLESQPTPAKLVSINLLSDGETAEITTQENGELHVDQLCPIHAPDIAETLYRIYQFFNLTQFACYSPEISAMSFLPVNETEAMFAAQAKARKKEESEQPQIKASFHLNH